MTPSKGTSQDSLGPSVASSTAQSPQVEITVEKLEGIIWSTPIRTKSRDDLKKRVPFVTAAVEFSGTCPNMKVYSASSFPHCKNPAVESYFAALDKDEWESPLRQSHTNEIRRIVSTTTQEIGSTGLTTKTTTTTITTTTTPVARKKEGHHRLVAKWYDDSFDDANPHLSSSTSEDDTDDSTGSLTSAHRRAAKPHLTLSLPSPGEQNQRSIFPSIFPSFHSRREDERQNDRQNSKTATKDLVPTKTHSTAASTTCSTSSARHQDRSHHQLTGSQEEDASWTFHDLGSLLDMDENDQSSEVERSKLKPRMPRQDEADVSPLIATQRSKELVATAIAAEPSSAIVGQADTNRDAFLRPSWLGCGAVSPPEIVELRVRVMPEDADEFDEMDPAEQHLAAAQDLEGVAHLVFLDQIVEEGTTIMDLPLKISRNNKCTKRKGNPPSPTLGEQDFVTLGANAMLRVRVSILSQDRHPTAPQPRSLNQFDTLHQSNTMKTQAIPDVGLPFYSRPFSFTSQVFPFVERVFQTPTQFIQFASEKLAEVYYTKKRDEDEDDEDDETAPQRRGPFPHEFPTVVPEDGNSKRVDSNFLGDWQTYKEPWGWPKWSSEAKSKETSRSTHGKNRRRSHRHENKKFYVPQSSSMASESSNDDEAEDSLLVDENDDLFTFTTRSVQYSTERSILL